MNYDINHTAYFSSPSIKETNPQLDRAAAALRQVHLELKNKHQNALKEREQLRLENTALKAEFSLKMALLIYYQSQT